MVSGNDGRERRPGSLIPVAVASLAVVGAAIAFVMSPLDVQLAYVPDDAFYYFQLAREFARSGRWSCDGGLTTTSGFHLLHGYFCALVYRIAPGASASAVLDTVAMTAAALAVATLSIFDDAVRRVFRPEARLAVLAVGGSGGFLIAPLMGMEWPWVALSASLLVWAAITRKAPLAFVASALGTLARSDFPLLPFAFLAACLASPRLRQRSEIVTPNLAAAVGSVLGFAVVTAHNLMTSGSFIQSSAQIKAHWGMVAGYSVLPVIDIAAKSTSLGFLLLRTLDLGPLVFVLIAIPVAIAVVATSEAPREVDASLSSSRHMVLLASLISGAGYVALYGRNAVATQLWYSASFLAPAFLGCAALFERLHAPLSRRAALAVTAILFISGVIDARHPEWPERPFTKQAASWAERKVRGARVGSWNAGVLAYFSQEQVINIDGLVNDEVRPFIFAGTLQCYLLQRDIRYVLDLEEMLEHPYSERGGYSDGSLRRALHERGRFVLPDGKPTGLVLYQVDEASIAADPRCTPSLPVKPAALRMRAPAIDRLTTTPAAIDQGVAGTPHVPFAAQPSRS
jgi:hypothetical protein